MIFVEILHVSYSPMSTKAWSGFLFRLDLDLFAKIEKDLVSIHSHKPGLSITQDLNQQKKLLITLLYTLVSMKRVQNFGKK